MKGSDPITAWVPARPEYVHILRAVVASVAARHDFPYDGIDDLKIAVDEACAHLLDSAPGAATLRLRIVTRGQELEALVSVDAEAPSWPPEGFEKSLMWQVLSALADETRLVHEGGPAVRLTKRLPEPDRG